MYLLYFFQDGYAVVASDGPGEYPVISESKAGSDGIGATVTPTNVAYVTTWGISLSLSIYILHMHITFNLMYKNGFL